MPESIASIAVFVALLAPGFIYLQWRESTHPGVKYTALRESSLVVTVSLLSLAVAVGLIALFVAVTPIGAPDLGPYIRNTSGTYVRDHYREVGLWAAVTLGLSCVVAVVLAIPPKFCQTCLERMGSNRKDGSKAARALKSSATVLARRRGSRRRIDHVSGWWKLFNAQADTEPNAKVHVDVTLVDGTWLSGRLYSFSTQIEENGDRDLLLDGDLFIKRPGKRIQELHNSAAMCVHADQIAHFVVRYVRPG